MSATLYALLGYAAWAILLAACILIWRTCLILSGRKSYQEIKSGEEHGSPIYWRVNRAHINTAENLPVFATVVLVAGFTEKLDLLSDLSLALLGARLLQSLIHISGGSDWHVNFRFTCMVAQHALLIWMGVRLLG